MEATAALSGLLAAAIVVGSVALVTLLWYRRFLVGSIVTVTFILLLLVAVPAVNGNIPVSSTSPVVPTETIVFVAFALGFFALVVVLYPASESDTSHERQRTGVLIAIVALTLLIAVPIMGMHNIAYLPVAMAFILTVMAVYTLGALVLGTLGKRDLVRVVGPRSSRRYKRSGAMVRSAQGGPSTAALASHPGWGACTLSHLLMYIPIVMLIAAENSCTSGISAVGLILGSFIIACIGALGVLGESERWKSMSILPLNAIDSAPNVLPGIAGF